jgi:uncharacterized protein (DUF1786 family)
MEPSYDVTAVRAQRQRRITRTRVAAALASGVTFGTAAAAFAVHGHAVASTTSVVTTNAGDVGGATTTTTTPWDTITEDTLPQPAVPAPSQVVTRSRGS